ncbi:MAG: hypothetical protein M3256_24840, partial [Actinomycetota bacterium]|nr:hypothetical protein [Actinomycetota bacterium]
ECCARIWDRPANISSPEIAGPARCGDVHVDRYGSRQGSFGFWPSRAPVWTSPSTPTTIVTPPAPQEASEAGTWARSKGIPSA